MPDSKISDFTDGGTPATGDEWVIARNGDNYKIVTPFDQFLRTTSSPMFNSIDSNTTNTNFLTLASFRHINLVAGDNYIQFQASNVGSSPGRQFINMRTGGAPSSQAGICYSSFGGTHYFFTSDSDLIFKIKYSNQNTDTPDFALANTIVQLTSAGNLTIGGNFSANNFSSGQYIATNLGTSGPVSGVITDRIVWSRTENVVSFAGTCFVQTSAASGACTVDLNLAISSTFPDSSYLRACVQVQNTSQYSGLSSLFLIGNTTNMRIGITKTTTSAVDYNVRFSGTYQIV